MAAFAFCRVKRHIITAFRDIRHRDVCHFNLQKNAQLYQLNISKKAGFSIEFEFFVSFCASEAGTKHRRVRRPFPDETAEDGSALTPGGPGRRSQSAAAHFQNNKKPGHSPGCPQLCADGKRRAHASQNRQHSITIHDDSPQRIPHTAQTPPPARTDAGFSALSLSRRPHSVGPDDCRY